MRDMQRAGDDYNLSSVRRGSWWFRAIPGRSVGGGPYARFSLEPNERVLRFIHCGHAPGRFATSLGYLTLTSSRLLFTGHRGFFSPNLVSLPYSELQRVAVARHRHLLLFVAGYGDSVSVRTNKGKEHFFWPTCDAESLANDIETLCKAVT